MQLQHFQMQRRQRLLWGSEDRGMSCVPRGLGKHAFGAERSSWRAWSDRGRPAWRLELHAGENVPWPPAKAVLVR